MKQFNTKIIISILTFAIGIFAVSIWLVKFKSDPTIYSVKFNTLIQESKNYDGKIVEIQGFYVQGRHSSFLSDSNHKEFITVTCALENESCEKVFDLLQEFLDRKEKVTVIGRYHDFEYQDYDGYVHIIEILEIKPKNIMRTTK